ncbi:MAG TPA: molybdopterin-dependent oxidoreductase, partial [Kofleriaceae bacterium]|nr:molybdopterin-dependent oxidoreductase [Kofleriaceae bacterium]
MASLAATFGRGAMTNGWVDIKNADVILAMGGNPAENHPVGFKWFMEARRGRGAKLVVVDPRFTRTAAVADFYAPIRPGTDIAFLLGIIRYAIENKRYHEDYVKLHTNASYLISDKYEFKVEDGLFSGFDPEKQEYARDTWAYAADEASKAYGIDADLTSEHCVFQLLKKHVSRYTPETVEQICGTPKAAFLKVAELVTSTGNAERVGTITYALGWTQHSTGVQIIRAAAMLQLLLGNVGRPGGGVNAFRGHSNIQGATDMAGTFEIIPGYLKTPTGPQQTLAQYNEATTPTTLNKQAWASMNYWSNTPKFMASLLKAMWGAAATPENEFGYSWLPKIDGNYSWMYIFDHMYTGKAKRAGGDEPGPEGFISFGMNPVGTGPNSKKMVAALAKLKWMVMVENVETETAMFWKAPAEYKGPVPSQIPTEVYLL